MWNQSGNSLSALDVGPRKNMFCVTFRLPFEVETVEKLVLAKMGGDKNDESADNMSNGKREQICEVNINEDVESKSSKGVRTREIYNSFLH